MKASTRYRGRFAGGFSLVEVAICTIIIGVAFVAAMELFITCSRTERRQLADVVCRIARRKRA